MKLSLRKMILQQTGHWKSGTVWSVGNYSGWANSPSLTPKNAWAARNTEISITNLSSEATTVTLDFGDPNFNRELQLEPHESEYLILRYYRKETAPTGSGYLTITSPQPIYPSGFVQVVNLIHTEGNSSSDIYHPVSSWSLDFYPIFDN